MSTTKQCGRSLINHMTTMNTIMGALRPHNSAMNIIKCWGGGTVQYSRGKGSSTSKQCGRSLINHKPTMNTIMGALRPHNSVINIIKCWGGVGYSTAQQRKKSTGSSTSKAAPTVWEESNKPQGLASCCVESCPVGMQLEQTTKCVMRG